MTHHEESRLKSKLIYAICTAICALLFTLGCGSDDGNGAMPADPDVVTTVFETFIELVEADGYTVQRGRNDPFFFPEDCADLPTCYAGNATSPYAFFSVPPAPGGPALPQFNGAPPAADKISPAFHLENDEVIVYLGETSPEAAYFSYAPYIFSRADADGMHIDIFASLADALNQSNIRVGNDPSPFGAPVAVIVSAHAGMAEQVKQWLIASGVEESRQNLMVIPSDIARLGSDPESDVLMILQRFALFTDPDVGEAYLRNPPVGVVRITPFESLGADPIPAPARTPRGTGADELHLSGALDDLETAIQTVHGEQRGVKVPMLSAELVNQRINPSVCIANLTSCLGEVSDTVYSAGPASLILQNKPNRLSDSPDDYFIVFGVNHEASGKALYSNMVVQNAARQAGIAAFTSREMHGSAEVYIPDHPDVDQLFAVKVARDCKYDPYCLEIPTDFPGIALDEDIMFLGRSYIEPGISVSPGPDEVLTERVLHYSGAD